MRVLSAKFVLDLRSLSLFRIVLGIVILCDLIVRGTVSDVFYSDMGVLPRIDLIRHYLPAEHTSLFLLFGKGIGLNLLWGFGYILALWFVLGYKTKYVTPLLWFFMVSIKARNPHVTSGGDVLLQLLLFWASFLPVGDFFSVDSLMKTKPSAVIVNNCASMGFVLQILVMYMATFIWKCHPVWIEGLAMRDVFMFDAYIKSPGRFLAEYPGICKHLTYMTLLIECVGPPLFLMACVQRGRLRVCLVSIFIAFHVGIFVVMELGTFCFVAISAWIALLPSSAWKGVQGVNAVVLQKRETDYYLKEGFLLCVCVYTLLWNLQGFPALKESKKWFKPYKSVGRFLRLEQKWSMFSPRPDPNDGWFVMEALLENGKSINVFNPSEELKQGVKPLVVSAIYDNHRLRKYFYVLRKKKYKKFRFRILKYYVDQWNQGVENKLQRINKATLVFYLEQNVDGVEQKAIKKRLATYRVK